MIHTWCFEQETITNGVIINPVKHWIDDPFMKRSSAQLADSNKNLFLPAVGDSPFASPHRFGSDTGNIPTSACTSQCHTRSCKSNDTAGLTCTQSTKPTIPLDRNPSAFVGFFIDKILTIRDIISHLLPSTSKQNNYRLISGYSLPDKSL